MHLGLETTRGLLFLVEAYSLSLLWVRDRCVFFHGKKSHEVRGFSAHVYKDSTGPNHDGNRDKNCSQNWF